MTSLSLYKKIENLPPALKKEAEDFIEFLLDKNQKEREKSSKAKKNIWESER